MIKKPPDRAAAAGDPVSAHCNHDLIKGLIRMLGDQFQQPGCMRPQRRRAPTDRLGGCAPEIAQSVAPPALLLG